MKKKDNSIKDKDIVIYPEYSLGSIRILGTNRYANWIGPIEEIPYPELHDQEFFAKVNGLNELYMRQFIPNDFDDDIHPAKEQLDQMLPFVSWIEDLLKKKVGDKLTVLNWADKKYLA